MDTTIKALKQLFGFAMLNNSKKEQGFTLVELLIATFIISIGILAWGKTLGGATKNRAISSDITTAAEFANSKMEHLALRLQTDPSLQGTGKEKIVAQGVEYTLTWTIFDTNNLASTWLIDLNVSWNHYGNKSVRYQRVVTGG